MKLIITLSKEIDDETEAQIVFAKLKQVAAINLDMTMSGYTNHQLDYDSTIAIDVESYLTK